MKKILIVSVIALGLSVMKADAQYVRSKPGFSIGISIGPRDPRPYPDAVWVGPEWVWRNGYYVEVPGHWVRMQRRNTVWVQGDWNYNKRRGYHWRKGHWRRNY